MLLIKIHDKELTEFVGLNVSDSNDVVVFYEKYNNEVVKKKRQQVKRQIKTSSPSRSVVALPLPPPSLKCDGENSETDTWLDSA